MALLLDLIADGGTIISAIQDSECKDIILGWLLKVHSHDPVSGGGKCGEVLLHKSVEIIENMFYVMDLCQQ